MDLVRLSFALVLLGGVAAAAPTPIATPPAGWRADPEQAAQIAGNASAQQRPAVEVWVPVQSGVALIVSRFSSTPASADAARAAIDDMFGAADRARIITPTAQILERSDHYDADRKEVVATQSVKSDTITVSRLVIAMDKDHTTAALGECVIRDDAPAATVEQCKTALVTLDPAIAARVAFTLPDSTAVKLEAPPATKQLQPTMTDGSKFTMPPITVPQEEPAKDRRPMYVGAGLVVLAAAFWWNRRARAKFGKDADD